MTLGMCPRLALMNKSTLPLVDRIFDEIMANNDRLKPVLLFLQLSPTAMTVRGI